MRKTRLPALLIPFLFFYSFTEAQTPTPISGIINTYHKVVGVSDAKNCVVVDNASGLAPGNRVMLVQMKGADIKTTSPGFGTVNNLNDAGNYELNTICTVKGDSVFLLYDFQPRYTVTGKVQLVYIPVYEQAIVVDSLKAKPWDNSTGKGGVLALSVTYGLTLAAPMSATGAGFKGGAPKLSGDDCNDVFVSTRAYYNANFTEPQQNGAFKGESVWELTEPQFSGGKGAAANGGGGGNNHNNGGGGGANLSAGGYGGGNNSATVCTVANPGEGGYALSDGGGARIFLGGGGGAGHVNNGDLLEGGGHGGGIIYVQAGSLTSSGYTISANGLKGGNSIGDGASGGGAGGTIVMNVGAYNDAVRIEALGGAGGRVDDQWINYKCYGEGGGGSGGVVYQKNAATGTINVSGGAKGVKINSMANCKPAVPGSAGTIGVSRTGYTPVQSTTLSLTCTYVLPTTLLYFRATVSGNDVTARWQVAQPEEVKTFVVERKREAEGWKEVALLAPVEGVDTYSATDRNLPAGSYTYRLKIVEQDGGVIYSSVQRVSITPVSQLVVYPNPASDVLRVLLPEDSGKELRVYDLGGRLVLRKALTVISNPLVSMEVSHLQEGLYVLRAGVHYKVFRIQ